MANVGLSIWDWRPRDIVELGVLAEEFGFDALWLGEHIVVPAGYSTVHPSKEEGSNTVNAAFGAELPDPWSALAAVAVVTKRIRLATGICIVPLQHPLVIARASITVHELSDGRFTLGAGAGWLREEFEALGVPFAGRGSRLEEAVAILRAAWNGGAVQYAGAHYDFEPMRVTSRSAHIPLVLGGNTERALRRAAALGDAWYASGVPTFDKAIELRARIMELRAEYHPDRPLECYMRMPDSDRAALARYEAAGFENIIIVANELLPRRDPKHLRSGLARLASDLGLR